MSSERYRILFSLFVPFAFVIVMWLVKLAEYTSGIGFFEWGVFPRTLSGAKGILTSPFIHGGLKHLYSNTIPVMVLGSALIYFYKSIALRVFIVLYLLSGLGLWLGGRPVYHIGASGVIYALTSFIFLSGILRKDTRLIALSLVVVFLYGGMAWGIFPILRAELNISWEAHLFGALAGFYTAYIFKNLGPQRKQYSWELEELEDEEYDDWLNRQQEAQNQESNQPENNPINITYHIKKTNNDTNQGNND